MSTTARKSTTRKRTSPSAGNDEGRLQTAAPRKLRNAGAAVSEQQRRRYIEVAAYYIAERRGFEGGYELQDWTEAELQIDCMLKEDRISS